MLNLSNALSLSRAALALVFLQDQPMLRFIAILCAMATDFLDGFLARRRGMTSRLGAVLDPIMDKFFVLFVGGVLYLEGNIFLWQFIALLSRDISLCVFAIYLFLIRGWKGYECKAIMWGKIITVCQFFILIALTWGFVIPSYIYFLFIGMATCAFIELFTGYQKKTIDK